MFPLDLNQQSGHRSAMLGDSRRLRDDRAGTPCVSVVPRDLSSCIVQPVVPHVLALDSINSAMAPLLYDALLLGREPAITMPPPQPVKKRGQYGKRACQPCRRRSVSLSAARNNDTPS